jgi:hypothetical protein
MVSKHKTPLSLFLSLSLSQDVKGRSKEVTYSGCWWLTPVILATQAEIRRIVV